MAKVKQAAPDGIPNADVLLRDQFECVLDGLLQHELKRLVRHQAAMGLLEVQAKAIRWKWEGMSGAGRGSSYSLPSAQGFQYAVQDETGFTGGVTLQRDLVELKELLKGQQEKLDKLTQILAVLRGAWYPCAP